MLKDDFLKILLRARRIYSNAQYDSGEDQVQAAFTTREEQKQLRFLMRELERIFGKENLV